MIKQHSEERRSRKPGRKAIVCCPRGVRQVSGRVGCEYIVEKASVPDTLGLLKKWFDKVDTVVVVVVVAAVSL